MAQNARLFAAASQAMDGGLIAVMDAGYHDGYWRPVTAICNGDRDDNAATDVDPGCTPLIDEVFLDPGRGSIAGSTVCFGREADMQRQAKRSPAAVEPRTFEQPGRLKPWRQSRRPAVSRDRQGVPA